MCRADVYMHHMCVYVCGSQKLTLGTFLYAVHNECGFKTWEYSQYSSVVECLAVHEVLSLVSSTWVTEKDFGAIDLLALKETLTILLYYYNLLVSFNLHAPSN